jgi:predicted nucleotide-binding protein (sugar kinase/HSP70/actin superfamily)
LDSIRVTFPHLGSYCVPLEVLFTAGMGVDYVVPPPVTARTLEIGSRYSPDTVCAPFKYNLGNYIESIEAGANTLLQVGGVCRLGYYGELHEQILKDLGYTARFVNTAKASFRRPLTFYEQLRSINPRMPVTRVAQVLPVVLRMVRYIDDAEDYIRKNVGFETVPGSFDALHKELLQTLRTVYTMKALYDTMQSFYKRLHSVETTTPKDPLRVGIIGEYYTIMEPYSNHFIEKELATMGAVVDRWMNISNSVLHRFGDVQRDSIRGYARYNMGATCMATIDRALYCARRGYDGVIHVKSFGCTPEMDVIPVLQNISADYKMPIIYLSYDSQTSEAGIQTRLEAFYDMIMMRKEGRKAT